MKKILSLVLALMMVLSLATTAFAGTFEDLKDSEANLQKATDLLSGLGIVQGFPDGEFKAEKGVTRAQMAVMLINARGLASIATDTPSFTDSQAHWAKGEIALASDLGIIKGRGNGIFDPDASVTYQEAAVMMLRALGYTDESINGGASTAFNAANYRTKAIALNIFKDLSGFVMNNGANRGNVALMLNRNLFNNRVETNDRGRAEVVEINGVKQTLLSEIAKPMNIDISLQTKAIEGVNLAPYLFQNVVAYVNADSEVIYVEKSNSKTVTGAITAADATSVTIASVKYTVNVTAPQVNFNGGSATLASDWAKINGSTATIVTNDNNDLLAIVAEKETQAIIITSTYKKDSSILSGKAVDKSSTTIGFPLKSGKVDLTKVTVTGAVDSLQDIEVNDVIKAYATIDGLKVKLLVIRESVQGKVTKANNAGDSVYIDSVGDYTSSLVTLAVANEGTFYLDENGKIFAFVVKTATAAQSDYVIITEVKAGAEVGGVFVKNPTIKVMDTAGQAKVYTIVETSKHDINGGTAGADAYKVSTNVATPVVSVGDVVKVTASTTDASVLSKVETFTLTQAGANVTTDKAFPTAANVAIFNVNGTTVTANTLDQLAAMKTVALANFYSLTVNGEYTVIKVQGTQIVPVAAATQALITAQQNVLNAAGKTVQEFTLYVDGEKVVYIAKEGVGSALTAGKGVYDVTVSGGVVNTIALTKEAMGTFDATTTGSAITSVLSTRFQANGTTWYFMDDNAPIYVLNSDNEFVRKGSMSDLEMLNATFYVYHTNNVVSNIVIVLK
jgi:hypothetical protein